MAGLKVHICVVCGESFQRKSAGKKNARLCCSRDCGFKLLKWRGEQSRRAQADKRMYARWARQAQPRRTPWQVRYKQEQQRKADVMAAMPCRTCSGPVGYSSMGRPRLYCSDECKPVTETMRRHSRAAKARRRAIERGAHAERFDPMEILERDAWRCHICGVRTPKRLRGTYDDRAPELDHIVPLAAGGEHSRRNTACACRKCNIAKSDRPLGQLRLVA
jgi:5-methylcytosine-specific restriction endonuclease McrA